MKLAILFWVYKDVEICKNRLLFLRSMNERAPIYTLYGGGLDGVALFQKHLAPLCDDFFVFTGSQDSRWKWKNGDLLLSKWYEDRGRSLDWDSVFVAQWDLLMLRPVRKLLRALKPEQVMLPGLRPIREVEPWWYWTSPTSEARPEFDAFLKHFGNENRLPTDLLCCQFLASAFPRSFMERYVNIPEPELGFLEYKIPIYAQSWGYGFLEKHDFHPRWFHDPKSKVLDIYSVRRLMDTLHAEIYPVSPRAVKLHAKFPFGQRVFHPFVDKYPL